MMKRKAFTLVELLVVIAIIALLMGILMPALSKVRRLGRATVCRTNVRQWGLVFKLYGEDNDSKLPQSQVGPGDKLTPVEAYWIVATLKYYKAKGIRKCPSTKIVREATNRSHGNTFACWGPFDPAGPGDWWADFDVGSYGINEWCATPYPGQSSYWSAPSDNAWKTQLVRGADRIPLFGDCVYVDAFPVDGGADGTGAAPLGFDPTGQEWNNGWGDWAMGANAMRLFCLPRHDGKVNLVFLDGSVGAVPLRALWTLKWHKNFDINGFYTKRAYSWPDWLANYGDEY